MFKIKYIFYIVGAGLLGIMASCKAPNYMTEHANVLLEYQLHPTRTNLLTLSQAYSTTLAANREAGSVQPGLYADYGVTLALLGRNSEANSMFNNEMALYPSSCTYMNYLKLELTPEYVSDTSTWVNLKELDSTLYIPMKEMLDKEEKAEEEDNLLDLDLLDEHSSKEARAAQKEAQQKQREQEKKKIEQEKQQIRDQKEADRYTG